MTTSPGDAVEHVIRQEYPRILATLIRITGDVDLAEDALQDGIVRALMTWPRDGVPEQPRAWLTVAARRCAVDRVRREAARDGKEADSVWLHEPDAPEPSESTVRDDLLRLVFTCCHPALSTEAQVALSLRTLGGLSTSEVARALLVPEPTMAKRLTRAKQKITRAGIPYRVPSDAELPGRLRGVLATVYLLFNEGYAPSGGDAVVRPDVSDEALRLGRLLHELMPDEASVTGLLALMLLQDSRRAARTDPLGHAVLLVDQDRSQWDHAQIRAGVELVGEALRRSPDEPDAYAVQAAIAACHALSPSYQDTDWTAIISWYDVLLTVDASPAAQLGRASAIAECDGAAAGLPAVEAIPGLESHPWWHAARAELLHRLGRHPEAAHARDDAIRTGLPAPHLRNLDESLARAPRRP
jgi:RNA polymerase sigma-70 factor (ECF subfamily)